MLPTLPTSEESYWQRTEQTTFFPKLTEDIAVDVAVVGGGIAGITIAYALKRSGLKVAVVEKNTIASGTTGGTTGKVTAQHGLIYSKLVKQIGKKRAKLYARSYALAMDQMKHIITAEKLDCDWKTEDNFVYTTNPKKIAKFKKEAAVAAELGLPASFETKNSLTFATEGAVKFANQARLNAVKYTRGLARIIKDNGSFVFERSNVVRIKDGAPGNIATAEGSVTANHIVVATKVPASPLVARLGYALLQYPETAYVVAGKTDLPIEGMYISPDKNHYSILPVQQGNSRYVLVGGENHLPGLRKSKERYENLAFYARQWFDVEQIEYRWKAMDYIAYDTLPLIGKMYPWSKNLYSVTGFKKWGLAASVIAARIIRSQIYDLKSEEASLFYPHRNSAPLKMPLTLMEYLRN